MAVIDINTRQPIAAEPEVDPGYSGHATQGDLYDRDRYVTAREIAASVREQIKAAQKAGDLPGKAEGVKFSVRSESFAGGQAVRIRIAAPAEWGMREVPEHESHNYWYPGLQSPTEEARRVGGIVRGFANRHVRADVDSQVDYFDVSCYVTVSLAGGVSL